MSSSRKSFSHERGRGRGNQGRRDSGDSWKKRTKCMNFDPQSGERWRECREGCGFAHPSDPEWSMATTRPSGNMGPPPDIPRHARDPPRDGGWGRGASSRPSGPRSSTGGKDPPIDSFWGKTIDATPFKSSDSPSTSTKPFPSGWGDYEWGDSGDAASSSVKVADGWGIPGPPAVKPAASSSLDGWGVEVPTTPTTNPVSAVKDTDGWGIPKINTSSAVGRGWGSPIGEADLSAKPVPAWGSEGLRADSGWAGMAGTRRASEPGSHPTSGPSASTRKDIPTIPPNSPLYTGFSFGKSLNRRSSTDNPNTGPGNNTAVVKPLLPLNKPDGAAEGEAKDSTIVVSSPPPTLSDVPSSSSNSITPKPSLKIVLPGHLPERQNSALPLLRQSPFAQLPHSSTPGGQAPMKSQAQLAWSGHIEVLSRAVTAQMERMQLNNVVNDRQRLISRIHQKSGQLAIPNIPDAMQENKAQDVDAKVQSAMAALMQSNGEGEQPWWPTPRGGVDYEMVLTALENDVTNLQQLLGEPDAMDDEMEVDVPDGAEFENLRKKRRSLFHEVQNMLPYIAERLRTTESFVMNQNEGLNDHVSRILEESHPPNTTPGASGLAKLEDLRERFEKIESRMANYLPELQRRRTLTIQRATDLKTLKTRYEELRRKEQELAVRKKKLTKEAQDLLAEMKARPTVEERVLQLTTSAAAQERMMRVMVPKLLKIAHTYRTEDLEYAMQCQVTAKAEVEAWRIAREGERKQRGEAFLKGLENDSTIKAVDLAGQEIERRWNEVTSLQRVARRSPAIRMIPGASGSHMS